MLSDRPLAILAISGSLRRKSSNLRLLQAIIALAPADVRVTMCDDVGQLPQFNPDLDGDDVPAPVAAWRSHVRSSDGVLICTPEYARGLPGSLKNALDWSVSSGEFVQRPVAVVTASPHPGGGDAVQASILGTLAMMSATVLPDAALTVPFVNQVLSPGGDITDDATRRRCELLMHSLVNAMERGFDAP